MVDKVYQAVVGLTFEGLKPPLRVEAGEPLPKRVPSSEIAQLLKDGHIREVPIKTTEESEGQDE